MTDPVETSLEVTVNARASADEVGPLVGRALRVRVTRPAADGEANRAVLRLLARSLHVSPSALALEAGERSRHKRIRVRGLSLAEVGRRLGGGGG